MRITRNTQIQFVGEGRISLFVKGMVHAFVTVPSTDYRTSHIVSKYAEITVLSVMRLRGVEKWILSVLFVQLKLC